MAFVIQVANISAQHHWFLIGTILEIREKATPTPFAMARKSLLWCVIQYLFSPAVLYSGCTILPSINVDYQSLYWRPCVIAGYYKPSKQPFYVIGAMLFLQSLDQTL